MRVVATAMKGRIGACFITVGVSKHLVHTHLHMDTHTLIRERKKVIYNDIRAGYKLSDEGEVRVGV